MNRLLQKSVRIVLVVGILVLSMVGVLSAQGGLTAEDGVVVAEGFNGPQGVLVDADGAIWVIDSGLGGEEIIPWISPEGQAVDAQFGQTAQIVKVAPDGTQEVIAVLPSVFTGADTVGGARLALLDGVLYATSGQGIGDPTVATLENAGAVVKIVDGEVTEVANLWDFERTENPDPALYDSHPYGLAAGADGMLYVTDAGANDLLKIDPATGDVSLIAVFAPIPGVFPRPDLGGELLTDAVPTGVVVGEDGAMYVSYLSGAPFVPGSAKVVMVSADGEISDYATGLTMLTDLQRGPDGHLYAVQFGIFTDQGPTPDSGAVLRIGEGDSSQEVISGLSFPTGISFDAEGNAYVVVNGVGAPGSGAVVKFDAVAAATQRSDEAMATPEATEEAAEEPMAEATAAPTEEPMAEATTVPTEEAVEEATAVPTEEAMEEATPAPTEEAMEEATAVPTEEAMEEATAIPTEEAMEEATAVPTEEAMEEATPAPTEEAMEEAPTTLPVTGGAASNNSWAPMIAVLFAVLTGGLLWRRHSAR
jgi:sugar lactone lactonase YvrE